MTSASDSRAVKVEISFVIRPPGPPSHHTDRRLAKVFDVDWPGRPMPGEAIEVDVGSPTEDGEFAVKGVYWLTENPTNVYLEAIVIPPELAEMEGEVDRYMDYCKSRGWKVSPDLPFSTA
jgi:hypothetical protein